MTPPDIDHPPQFTSAKPKPAKAVKPRRMWLSANGVLYPTKAWPELLSVIIIHTDSESIRALVSKAGSVIDREWRRTRASSGAYLAQRVLESIGPSAKRPSRKRRGAK